VHSAGGLGKQRHDEPSERGTTLRTTAGE
jgi:hypothetical protein